MKLPRTLVFEINEKDENFKEKSSRILNWDDRFKILL